MNADFLVKNCDGQVLDNYLKLLAFTAQKRMNNDHALMALRLENVQLKENLNKLNNENNKLINNRFDDLFDNENALFQAELNSRIKKYLFKRIATGAKSLYISGVDKISMIFKEKIK